MAKHDHYTNVMTWKQLKIKKWPIGVSFNIVQLENSVGYTIVDCRLASSGPDKSTKFSAVIGKMAYSNKQAISNLASCAMKDMLKTRWKP